MEISTRYHSELLEKFKEDCPMWANSIDTCAPRHMHSIRVTLYDGTKIDYNGLNRTFRRVAESVRESPADYSDEECRRAIKANLIEMMGMQGVNQVILAKRTGLSTAMISKYIKGDATPSATNLKRLALALNCYPEDFYV